MHALLRIWRSGESTEPRSRLEDTVVRDEWQSEPDGRGGNPTVAVVNLATQRMSNLPTTLAQRGAHTNHLVVGMDNGEFSKTSFQPTATQLSPAGAQRSMVSVFRLSTRN
jgi:hypothetical protein